MQKDTMQDKLQRLAKFNDKQKSVSEINYKENSKERLRKIIRKKMQTTFIGDLSIFEKYFGQIWGDGYDERHLSDEQREFSDLWETCRREILNNGNNQLRALDAELSLYEIVWNKHQLNLTGGNGNG